MSIVLCVSTAVLAHLPATRAHTHTHLASQFTPQWHSPVAPSATSCDPGHPTTRCTYCGSMPPCELAAAIRAGAQLHWADRKYGWPHKVYVEGIPNRFAGMPAIRSCSSCSMPPEAEIAAGKWTKVQDGFNSRTGEPRFTYQILGAPIPEPQTTHGKFYSEHLQDASPEDRVVIERAMGLSFKFLDDGRVGWEPFDQAQTSA